MPTWFVTTGLPFIAEMLIALLFGVFTLACLAWALQAWRREAELRVLIVAGVVVSATIYLLLMIDALRRIYA